MEGELTVKEVVKDPKSRKQFWSNAIPIILAVVVVLSIVMIFSQRNRAVAAERKLDNIYQNTFNEIVGYVSNINTDLDKLMVVTSPQQYVVLLNEVSNKSNQVRGLLGQLPVSHGVVNSLSQFITRVGDFCYMMNKSVVDGTPITDENMEQLHQINQTCTEIANQLLDIQSNGGMIFGENGEFYSEVTQDENAPEYKLARDQESYPRLIYDGPFSESTENMEAKGLYGAEIDAETAKNKAIEFLGQGTQLEQTGEITGTIPAWTFAGTLENGREVTAAVTKTGQMYWMNSNITGDDNDVSEEEAQKCAEIARLYLQQKGFETAATYSQHYAGSVVVNLAAVQGDVILYPDLIKVWVDVQTGEITGLDFRNYLMAHQERALTGAALTLEDARGYVSPSLIVQTGGRLALIPREDNTEVLCYEFSGMYEDNRFMVYINAENGEEEDVLLILDTANGTLVE